MQTADWVVVAVLCLISLGAGLFFTRRASRHGVEGYFTGDRKLPWWAIGLSNTATYQSGNGAFVMLLLINGLAGNWLWWSSWIIWMPLVAVIYARLWRRMQVVTTAELISLRYGGRPAVVARKAYAVVSCLGFSVIVIAYITGFFTKTVAPLLGFQEWQILLIFGATTALYTIFGGLTGVVYTDVVQFAILLIGNAVFLWLAIPQHGGWEQILHRVTAVRADGLVPTPPTAAVSGLTVAVFVLQGLFFAGSPTAGEGMTAQRFMAAKNERHAVGGQLFNAFLALTLRTLPLIGLGIIAMGLFWGQDMIATFGAAPAGTTLLDDSAHAWAELIKRCTLPAGFVGVLVAAEAAAYMSTLSSLINWGGSFVVNDLLPPQTSPRTQVWLSRAATATLFTLAAMVTILYVNNMMSWFLFINATMVVFLLPLAWFRFFWWRFNVWGELAAILLGLPLSIVVWFWLDFQKRPPWQGIGLLFALSFVVLIAVTFLTAPEKPETLRRFYERCRPPGLWGGIRSGLAAQEPAEHRGSSTAKLFIDAALGILACLGLVLATNAVFVKDWWMTLSGTAGAVVLGGWLMARILDSRGYAAEER